MLKDDRKDETIFCDSLSTSIDETRMLGTDGASTGGGARGFSAVTPVMPAGSVFPGRDSGDADAELPLLLSITVVGVWGSDDADVMVVVACCWCCWSAGGALDFASGVDIISDLKRLCLPPNIMLPRLEKERAPKSSHRLSSGIGVLIGAKDLSSVVAEQKGVWGSSLSALTGPGTPARPSTSGPVACGGSLGDLGDLAEPRNGSASGGAACAAALSAPSIFFRSFFDPLDPVPKPLLNFVVNELRRVGEGDGDGADCVGEVTVDSGFSGRGGMETVSVSGGGANWLMRVDWGGLTISSSSSEYTDGVSAIWSNIF
jgi:hypothetical protein